MVVQWVSFPKRLKCQFSSIFSFFYLSEICLDTFTKQHFQENRYLTHPSCLIEEIEKFPQIKLLIINHLNQLVEMNLRSRVMHR